MAEQSSIHPPRSVGAWTRAGEAKRVGTADIFDYMDGAGELYLGYRFRFLDVWEYRSPREDSILMELYQMRHSDDAYGLLSGDWGGEKLDLGGGTHALYGAGLLRIWSGDLYARVMAYKETDAARQAVLELGRAIVAGRPTGPVPEVVRALPEQVGDQFRLLPERSMFLRSHLVLNSAYFLSSENLLDLNHDCELASAAYTVRAQDRRSKPARLLLVRYKDADAARAALQHFLHLYLPERKFSDQHGFAAIEDGWTGFELSGRALALAFEVPDEAGARLLIERASQALKTLETAHE